MRHRHSQLDADGNIYVYESIGGAIRRIDGSTHRITTVAEECDPPSQKPTPTGCFGSISGLQVMDSGNLLFSEFTYNRVSSYDPVSHRFTVIAGSGDLTSGGDGGQARDARPSPSPALLGVTQPADIFVCDSSHFIRRIRRKTGIHITRSRGSGKTRLRRRWRAGTERAVHHATEPCCRSSGQYFRC